jgi:FKBP-type peptidyl-prolyl cis-trans isomerase
VKRIILVVAIVFLCLAGTIGYGLKNSHKSNRQTAVAVPTEVASSGSTQINTSQSNAPLASQQPSGVTLGDNTGSSQSTSLQSNLGGQPAPAGSAPSPKKQADPFDPATFAQYDSHKAEPHALFGDVQVGTGAVAKSGSKVAVVYKGWLTNGSVFDQSHTDPATGKIVAFQFAVGSGSVIQGWEEGIVGMKVGGTRLLVVPPAVGYGAAGKGSVPANAVMVFEVQLADVQ